MGLLDGRRSLTSLAAEAKFGVQKVRNFYSIYELQLFPKGTLVASDVISEK